MRSLRAETKSRHAARRLPPPCPNGVNHEAVKRSSRAWSSLAYVGIQEFPRARLEMRNCACGSTLYIVLEDLR